ncbi:hypothetical protein [Rhizobium leguminosarum]|uniref:hypothetical protein n=1 Tax=Rhizobium leguminosarum TaxID=384 RepID=UPI002E132944|nr:hypothetical protein U8Q02_41785 [Rhizobium leguminosarum]
MRGIIGWLKSLFSLENLQMLGVFTFLVACILYLYVSVIEGERGRCAKPDYAARTPHCERYLKHGMG